MSVPMTIATRVSGPAPLSVVFDPIGAASGVVQPEAPALDHKTLAYTWDFDDPSAGVWAHTGRSKNRSNAWIGAHVFETPGSYRVLLTIIDAAGTVFEYHEDITVTDPDVVFAARTFYVAGDGSDLNPGTISQPFLTASAGVAAAFAINGAARLRFRRGDTFTPSGLTITGTGPRLIDSYGTGANPILAFSSGGFTVNGTDVRICDLDCTATGSGTGIELGTLTNVCRCTLSGFDFAMGSNAKTEFCIYDCELIDSVQYGAYLFGVDDTTAIHLAVLGTLFDVAPNGHLIRTYMSRSVIEACRFEEPGFSSLKLVGRPPTPDVSHHVCVVGNYIGCETAPGILGIGPENETLTDQVATDYLVEGNYFYSRTAGNSCIRIMGPRITVRNNIFDLTDNRRAIRVEPWGASPEPTEVVVEHNTFVSAGAILYVLEAESSDLTVLRNNLYYCPGGTIETPIGDVSASGNVTATSNPFETLPGIVGGEFALTTSGTNPAVDTAVASLTRRDFAGRPRPFGAGLDVGAFERQGDVLSVVGGNIDFVFGVDGALSVLPVIGGNIDFRLGVDGGVTVTGAPTVPGPSHLLSFGGHDRIVPRSSPPRRIRNPRHRSF